MCWNETVSLNTYIVGLFTMCFVLYNQMYTDYKIDKGYYYVLFLNVFITMQLIEYFLWKAIKNHDTVSNALYSKLGLLLIFMQPLASIMLITSNTIRHVLGAAYCLATALFILLKNMYNPFIFKTFVGENKHLAWKWLENKGAWQIYVFFWFFCLSASAYTERASPLVYIISVASFILYYRAYKNDLTFGTLWCHIINVVVIALLFTYLFVFPLKLQDCSLF
jgi:hypothetical protein